MSENAYRNELAANLSKESDKGVRKQKLEAARQTEEYKDAERWRQYVRYNEMREKNAARFDGQVLTLLNDLGLGEFRIKPPKRDYGGSGLARFDVGSTRDGKLSGWLYGYEIMSYSGYDLFNPNNSSFKPLLEDDIANAIAIVFKENGLNVYKNRDELIVEGKDNNGVEVTEKDEQGKIVGTVRLHTLYADAPTVFSDGLMNTWKGEIYKQGDKLFLKPRRKYDESTGKNIDYPAEECTPFTLTAKDFKEYILTRKGIANKK